MAGMRANADNLIYTAAITDPFATAESAPVQAGALLLVKC
jgi:hypothetical protein